MCVAKEADSRFLIFKAASRGQLVEDVFPFFWLAQWA
jgi:hypothetical protein